jgi:hypothetical protein
MNRRNQPRRLALVLALLVLAAIVSGVATSATTTVIPKRLAGRWERGDGEVMVVGRRGWVSFNSVLLNKPGWSHAEFLHGMRFRLNIIGPKVCSGTGTYRWTITDDGFIGDQLNFKKIHDACKLRVSLLTSDYWARQN